MTAGAGYGFHGGSEKRRAIRQRPVLEDSCEAVSAVGSVTSSGGTETGENATGRPTSNTAPQPSVESTDSVEIPATLPATKEMHCLAPPSVVRVMGNG
jgi:hypothetical protein